MFKAFLESDLICFHCHLSMVYFSPVGMGRYEILTYENLAGVTATTLNASVK